MRKIKKKLDINKRNKFLFSKKLIIKSLRNEFRGEFGIRKNRIILEEFRIRNRCAYTGRSRSVLRKFRLSRSHLQFFIYSGYFSGTRRTSW